MYLHAIYHNFVIGLVNHYYLGFLENYNGQGSTINISVVLVTSETQLVKYFIEAPNVGYYRSGTLSAGDQVILYLPSSVEVSSPYDQDNGVYLTTSSENVTVIGQSSQESTSESFYAFPIVELDEAYVHYGISVPRAIIHSEHLDSSILVVGTKRNTLIKLTVTQSVNIIVDDVVTSLVPGRLYSFVISRLQTIYIASIEDLSGTKIITDKPVSVFSGHQCGNVPLNITACSHLTEQIPPTALWGKVYYVAPLVNRTAYTLKVLAAYDSTIVNLYCNNTRQSYTINEGVFFNKTSKVNEYCAVYSNKEVLVVQFSHGGSENDYVFGDPMMTLVPATNQYLNKFEFSTIRYPVTPNFNHYLNIIVKARYYQPNKIHIVAGGANRSLITQQWVQVQVNNVVEAYIAQVAIPEGTVQIVHTNPAAQMTAIAYGFASHDGYGHIGGIHSHIGRNEISAPTGC